MKYDNLSKDELVLKIEKLELDLIKSNSINKKLEKTEDLATQQSSILKFINSMAIPSADKSTIEEFSKTLLKALKEYTGAVLAAFSLYLPDKKELLLLHIEAEQGMLKKALKIAGDKIVRTASPVDDETYKLIIKNQVYTYNTFTEVSFGAIPKLIDKALRASTGIDRLYPIAHVIEGELYGTTMLAFKKGQTSPSMELLESYAHLMSVSLRRYNAEKALKESEEKYHSLIENLPVVSWQTSEEGETVFVSSNIKQVYGYSATEIYENGAELWFARIHPNDIEKVKSSFSNLFSKGTTYKTAYRIKRKDGEWIWLEDRATHVKTINGKRYAYGAFFEATIQKEAESKLQKNEHRFRLLAENAKDMIYRMSIADAVYEYVSPSSIEMFGYTPEEFYNTPFLIEKVIHPDWVEYFKTEWQNLLDGNMPPFYEYQIIDKSGKTKWVNQRNTLINNEEGKPIAIEGAVTDVTERKQMEEELLKNQKRYKKAQAIGNVGNWEFDLVTTIFWGSDEARKIFGFNPELKDLSTERVENCIQERVRVHQALIDLIEKDKKYDLVYDILTEDKGIRKTIHSIAELEKDAQGNPLKVIGVINDITIQKKAEEALIKAKENAEEKAAELKKQQALFETMFNTIKEGVVITNIKREIVLANNGMLSTFGFKPEELIGKQTKILYANDEKFEESGNKSFNKDVINPTNQYLTFYKHKSKRIFPGETFGAKLYDHHDNWIGNIGIMRDVTEREKFISDLKIAKERAEESKANITAIIEGTKNSIWAFNRNYQIIYINREMRQEFLKSFDVLLKPGMNLVEALPESLQPFWKPRYDRVLNNEQFTIEDTIPTENGTLYLEVTFNPIVKNGQVIGGSCFGSNITSRKLAEIELMKAKEEAEESERKLIEAQELAHIGSWEYIIDTDTVTWSKELFNIFERSHDLPAPKYFEQRPFYTKESFVLLDKAVQDCVQREIPYEIELDIIVSDGSKRQIISKGNVIKDKNNKIIGSYGTAQDITQKKKIEREIIAAKEKAEESDRLKSAFLANMSHEIRTPMNGILGFTNLLKEPGLTGEDQQKFIGIIEKSGDRMLSTINDIIDISKIEAGQVDVTNSEINLNKQLDELLEFFLPEAKKKNIILSVRNRVPDQHFNIKSDKEKLNSILTNFIKNAIKYTHSGSIEFGYSVIEKDKRSELEFYVKDTGVGIPKERQEAVFGRFIQADIEDKQVFEGSGLGLAISKAYVEMLGGRIWVESEEGVGSQFYFTIPYSTINKEIQERYSENSNKKLAVKLGLKVLIVDDDEFTVIYLSQVLKEFKKEMLIARTGIEAVELCRTNPDIDIVLMDIKIPGIDGYEATRKIREFNKEVFILAQTAFAQNGDREKSINAGCDDYISKPINKEKLLEIISNRF